MIPQTEGTYNAGPINIGVDETGPNNLTTVIVEFDIFEELTPDGPVDVTEMQLGITHYIYLEKKDGSLNTISIDALKAAFGWDGRDPFWLQDNAEQLREKRVQLVLGNEQYNGKVRMKVKRLNPYGYTGGSGGVSRADGSKRQAIANRLGPKLRAISGGAPAPAAMPAGKPAAPAKAAAPAAKPRAAAPAAKAGCTMQDAWEAFALRCKNADGSDYEQDRMEAAWFSAIEKLFPGRELESLTPAEWATVKAKADPIPF